MVSRGVVAAERREVAPAPLVEVPPVGDGDKLAVQRRDLGELERRAGLDDVGPELEVVAEPQRALAQRLVALLVGGRVVVLWIGVGFICQVWTVMMSFPFIIIEVSLIKLWPKSGFIFDKFDPIPCPARRCPSARTPATASGRSTAGRASGRSTPGRCRPRCRRPLLRPPRRRRQRPPQWPSSRSCTRSPDVSRVAATTVVLRASYHYTLLHNSARFT